MLWTNSEISRVPTLSRNKEDWIQCVMKDTKHADVYKDMYKVTSSFDCMYFQIHEGNRSLPYYSVQSRVICMHI